MDEILQYVLGVCAAAMICAMILCFAEKGPMEPLLKLICGLILTFTLIDPLLNISDGNWSALGIDVRQDAEAAADKGIEQARKSVSQIIKEDAETYIQDKARELGLHLNISIDLSEQSLPVPESATVKGIIPPYAKQKLTAILEEELGIKRENQKWIS